jgi:ATP-dependent helicase HrpA
MTNNYPDLYPLIPLCMLRDQHRFQKTLNRLCKQLKLVSAKDNSANSDENGNELASRWSVLQSKIEKSIKQTEARRSSVPEIQLPENLPVSQKAKEITDLIQSHQVVVIAGETGSGKTTQLPKICLNMGRGIKGMIGHTQPRRLAARAVSSRIAVECGTELGDLIGFKVRFGDQVTSRSLVKLMTDGILLAEIQNDPYLRQYDTLIIDEAHERSLNIDFLLGYIKQLLPKRPELKVIITSATIDVERFSKHFNNAPVYEISGRTFPVDVFYRPWQEMDVEDEDSDLYSAIGQVVLEIEDHERQAKSTPGDILIFVPGEREIRDLSHKLKDFEFRHTEIVPLYARLSHNEQSKIFSSHAGRRIVLSTNVASLKQPKKVLVKRRKKK